MRKLQNDANPQSKRLKTLKQGIAKKIALRRDKISTYYKDNTNTADIAALESEVAKYEVDKSAIGRLQEMESIINEIGRKDPAAQLAIDRLRVQGYFSFDKFRDFFDNNNTKTKKILMEALNARRSKIDYNFWTSLVNNYASWKTVFGQHPDIHRVPVFVQTIEEAFNKLK
uniref:Uncharacterized protein n=1 Tax=Panagrolaimus superbus TaxID=310955 RepID=A0A914ZC37_9BILA